MKRESRKQPVTIWAEPSLVEALRLRAAAKRRSVSYVGTVALEQYLKQWRKA